MPSAPLSQGLEVLRVGLLRVFTQATLQFKVVHEVANCLWPGHAMKVGIISW